MKEDSTIICPHCKCELILQRIEKIDGSWFDMFECIDNIVNYRILFEDDVVYNEYMTIEEYEISVWHQLKMSEIVINKSKSIVIRALLDLVSLTKDKIKNYILFS